MQGGARNLRLLAGAVVLGAVLLVAAACARVPLATSLRGVDERSSGPRAAFDALRGDGGVATVTNLSEGPTAWAARWQGIAAATETIDASYFIVEEDVFGVAFLGHLYARALAGLKVRLIIDAHGNIPMTGGIGGRDYLQELSRVGVEVHVFNPPFPQALKALATGSLIPMAAGTHNKTLVFDDRTAITGGRNIAAPYFVPWTQHPGAFVDLDLLLQGTGSASALRASVTNELRASEGGDVWPELVDVIPRGDELLLVQHAMDAWLNGRVSLLPADQAVLELEESALTTFKSRPSSRIRARARVWLEELVRYTALWGTARSTLVPDVTAEVRVVSARSRALDNDDIVNASVVRCIGGAQRNVVIETPYFVLTPRLLAVLQEASARGVTINVMTNSPVSSDNDVPQSLFVGAVPELLARIPTLRLFVPKNGQTLHLKRIIVDDELTLVGTYNFDPFSMHLNSETVVGVWSDVFNRSSRQEADARITQAFEYRVQRDSAGRVHRYPEGHPYAGQVVMVFGPRDHVSAERLAELADVKELMMSVRNMFDFDVVTW